MTSIKVIALAAAIMLSQVASLNACMGDLKRDWTIQGPGGSYGYLHWTLNNMMAEPSQPTDFHYRMICIGPWWFELTKTKVAIAMPTVVLVAVGFFSLKKWNRQPGSRR